MKMAIANGLMKCIPVNFGIKPKSCLYDYFRLKISIKKVTNKEKINLFQLNTRKEKLYEL